MIPDGWDKVNFSQFMAAKPGMTVTELLAVFLEKPAVEVAAMRIDLEDAFKKLAFLDQPVVQSIDPNAPQDLEVTTIGQYEDMRLYVRQMKGTPEDFVHYPVIFATYWQNPYIASTVDGLIKYVNRKPCGVVLGTVQHYLKEMERIDAKWAKLFPKDGYTAEQKAAGFPQLDEFFGHYRSLLFAEKNSKWDRDTWSGKTVTEFKYFMLHLALEGQAAKKHADGQAAKVRAQTPRGGGRR